LLGLISASFCYFSSTFPFCVVSWVGYFFFVTWWASDLLGTFREHEPAAGYERVAGKLGANYFKKAYWY
jgi:hypothetical protein